MNNKPLNILLAEDNPGDIKLMQDFMLRSKVPNNLVTVENGAQALDYLYKKGKYFDASVPHLIILDLNMPIKGGREVLLEIKSDPQLKHIPVIVLTTSDAEQDIYNSYLLQANCYLTKPNNLNEFCRLMSDLENFWMMLAKLPRH